MEYYPAIKRNGVLIHVMIWMKLELIMLSRRSQPQKTTDCLILRTTDPQFHFIIMLTRLKKTTPSGGPACVESVRSLCLRGLSPGPLVSFHTLKMCMFASLVRLHCLSMRVGACASAQLVEWYPVQGWLLPHALSCQDRLQPPVTLNWNEIRKRKNTNCCRKLIKYPIITQMHDSK